MTPSSGSECFGQWGVQIVKHINIIVHDKSILQMLGQTPVLIWNGKKMTVDAVIDISKCHLLIGQFEVDFWNLLRNRKEFITYILLNILLLSR